MLASMLDCPTPLQDGVVRSWNRLRAQGAGDSMPLAFTAFASPGSIPHPMNTVAMPCEG